MVLRPREGHDIRVEEMRLEIEPDYTLHWSRDVFGNSVATVHLLEPSATLNIRNHLLLTQAAHFPTEAIHAEQPSFPPQYEPLEMEVVAAYRATVFPEDAPAVFQWTKRVIDCSEYDDAEKFVAMVNRKIHDTIRYTRRETKGVQGPAVTLLQGTGSCRDLATLLLEVFRALGFPARFASGYLDCAASEAGRASTHAWAEAYLPDVGWRGYDPTLGEQSSEKHVVLGVSNHPRGVMPVVGSFYGYQSDFTEMRVRVLTDRCQSAVLPGQEPR